MMPSPRLLLIVLAWAAAGAPAGAWDAATALWYGAGLLLLLAAGLDAWLARRAPPLRLERKAARVWPVGVWNTAALSIHNEGGRRLRIELFDDYPGGWEMQGLPYAGAIAAGAFSEIGYRLRPDRRGDARFGAPHLRVLSPLGLWQGLWRIGPAEAVKVFPDFSTLLGHTLQATGRRTPSSGALRKRRRGEGTDFRQLRDFRQGDSQRAIDWKATARRHKPISREYQEERDQQVVFLLDTGRRMLAEDAGASHFDHALNAVLTLAFLAQKQGDAVGLMTFGAADTASAALPGRWLAPQKGRAGFDRLLAGLYDVQAAETAPDYARAAAALLAKLGKRAFVVLITNLRDEDDQAMRSACELIGAKHMVLCASLREKALDQAVAAPVDGFGDALRQSAAMHYLQQRRDAIGRLGLARGRLVDVAPDQLGLALVDRYLDIKESGQL
ncbi:MAG TPA: DUF58 domain-containing protein [Janthinobacterium sp.]|nr:DUF58 domain-containing protein [Janthinobacterium sp.]